MHAILIHAADSVHGDLVRETLHSVPGRNYLCLQVSSVGEALGALADTEIDAIVADDGDGAAVALLAALAETHRAPPVVVVGGDERSRLRAGAADHVARAALAPLVLRRALDHAIEKQHLRERVGWLRLRLHTVLAERDALRSEVAELRAQIRDGVAQVEQLDIVVPALAANAANAPDTVVLIPRADAIAPSDAFAVSTR